ncbi:MAG: reverse transcriptase family protein, partial [Oscillospiraceae bacterium]
TCICSKVLETIISIDLLDFLLKNKLINRNQHGFLKKHSTCTNLLEALNDWTISISNHKSVVIGYIDFTRAFDSIPHPKLFYKLQNYGVAGNLLNTISDFLFQRYQSVRVGSHFSKSCIVTSGVPQGSVLGPLLFNIYVNDISDNFDPSIKIKLFADDVKLYTELTHRLSAPNFQHHLTKIQSWADTWQIQISYSKCNMLQLGTAHPLPFHLSSSTLPHPSFVKDLGIIIDPSLKLSCHLKDIITRAKQRSSLIYRCFVSRDITNLVKAFLIYVRPILEYASPVWSPYLISQINEIESVQRGFTKRLPGFSGLSYADRLANLKLHSLEHRRLISDLTFYYNIIHSHSSLLFDDFLKFNHNTTSRGHPFRLNLPLIKHNTRKYFFSCRFIRVWNSLPVNIVCASTTQQFKKLILVHDLSEHLIFP